MAAIARPVDDRIKDLTQVDDKGCWVWQGYCNSRGYGMLTVQPRKTRQAHRVSFEAFRGPLVDGLVIDHLCRNTKCVNPVHLDLTTSSVNAKRALYPNGRYSLYRGTTHCKNGHPFDETNTYRYVARGKNSRGCLVCRRATSAAHRVAMKGI